MPQLATLVVTNNSIFRNSVETSVDENLGRVLFADSVDAILPIMENAKNKISNLVCEIPEELGDFEKKLRQLKRNDCAKYVPCIGVLTENSSSSPVSRQLFFHILQTPLHDEILPHTIEAAQSDFKRYQALISEVNSRTSAIGLIESGKFTLQTLQQAEALTTMLSLACPDPATVALGLSELLVNAIEHGNLSISYEEKSALLEAGEWDKEVQKRLKMDSYKDRIVEIYFERYEDRIEIVIKDQGNGFDWRKHIGSDPSNFTAKHGRGIAIAIAMGFSQISYNDKGNQVTATINL